MVSYKNAMKALRVHGNSRRDRETKG